MEFDSNHFTYQQIAESLRREGLSVTPVGDHATMVVERDGESYFLFITPVTTLAQARQRQIRRIV